MNKSAVQRIIATLKETGYVEKAPDTTKYRLTLSIWELGSHVVDQHQARRLIHPVLRFAAQSTGFTAFLAYLSFPFVVYLDKVEGAHGRVHTAEPGSRIPMTRTAAGKAILAFLPDSDLIELARNHTDWTRLRCLDGHVDGRACRRDVKHPQAAFRDIARWSQTRGEFDRGTRVVARCPPLRIHRVDGR